MLLYTDTVVLPVGKYINVSENFVDVDKIVFTPSPGQTLFLMDNFNCAPLTPVPEPSAWVLFAGCMLGLLSYPCVRRLGWLTFKPSR
jgi:hypothetical protein